MFKGSLLWVFLATMQHLARAFNFANKKALVTGSSGGIGAAIAKELANKGARVLVHYNTRQNGAKETKQEIIGMGGICDGLIQCDFRDPKNVNKMMSIIDQQWGGGIDILVNNAGLVTKLAAEDEDDSFSSWMETIQVNLNAPYQLSKLAYERMKKQKEGGNIINVSSIHGAVSVEYMVAYAASKAAMDRMTAGLSNEWAKDGVRVNAIAPGIVPVERTEAILSQQASQDLWLPHLPVGRMGTVQECAHAVVYLCENEWTSGTVLTLDGGMTGRSNMPVRPKPTPPNA
ncbi:unnamed protein product, partial [Heterosigma akashiwo]